LTFTVVNPGNLVPGTYTSTISFNDPNTNAALATLPPASKLLGRYLLSAGPNLRSCGAKVMDPAAATAGAGSGRFRRET
jgi:hypothetical protein